MIHYRILTYIKKEKKSIHEEMPKGIVKILKSVYLAQIDDSSVEEQRHPCDFAE